MHGLNPFPPSLLCNGFESGFMLMRTLELKHYIKQFVCLPLKKILSTHIVYDKCTTLLFPGGSKEEN